VGAKSAPLIARACWDVLDDVVLGALNRLWRSPWGSSMFVGGLTLFLIEARKGRALNHGWTTRRPQR
jgi:hypothetical protein